MENYIKFIILAIAVIIGYIVVNFIIKRLQSSDPSPTGYGHGRPNEESKGSCINNSGGHQEGESSEKESEKEYYLNLGERYVSILQLGGQFTPSKIKPQYHLLIAKYHPDKVSHLGIEFQKIAERKMQDIVEAYAYFREKYKLD
jgi:hypothetical protein